MEKIVLPPGFRFHPTDEELVFHYLKRKVCGQKIAFEAIAELDLYKYEPWDLPERSFLQTRDLEWYFFIPRDRKYPNGSRTNRATEKGYWKSTGKDRFVSSKSRNVGTKKTLVYYSGRAPKGERTNWVMHEYRLNDAECQRINASENGFVLCRVYHKSGAGPKNGEQYGAPVEEDDEFESSPPVEGDGSGSFKAGLFGAGPSSASAYYVPSPTSGSRNEAISHDVNSIDSYVQPRNLQFADSLDSMTSDIFQKESSMNHLVTGCYALPAYGVGDSVAPVCNEEDSLLQELYKLVVPDACADQLESTDVYQDPTSCVGTGFYQPGTHPPSNGDFLELNDLLSVSDCEDGIEAIKPNKKQMDVGLKDFSGESECSSLLQMQQAVPTLGVSDCSAQWQEPFGDGMDERQPNLPESMQMHSSVSTAMYNSQYPPSRVNLLESLLLSSDLCNEELGAYCQPDSLEPDYEDVLEFFARASEDKSFNVESFAENIHRGFIHSEDNSLIPSQDGQYHDALLSFTDIDTYGDTRTTAMHTTSNFWTPQTTLTQASLANKVDEVLNKLAVDGIVSTEDSEGVAEANDFVTESVLRSQGGEGITLGQGKPPPSPLSILWSCLDSLPTLPASAADLSPKAVSPGGSIRVTATGVGVGAVSVTCTGVGDGMPSSSMNCSVADAKKTEGFVKSLSFIGQRSKPSDKWRIGYYTLAVFAGLWAIFWLLIAGGMWKHVEGVYRRMVASEM